MRKKDEGDFYACRDCNSKKSILDELFCAVAKFQSSDPDLAAQSLIRSFTKRENIPARYLEMYDSAEYKNGEYHAKMPLTGTEIIEYANYFGMGLYFLKHRKVLKEDLKIMHIKLYNKEVHRAFEDKYNLSLASNPIRDLEQNKQSWVTAPNECVIWSENNENLIIFHDFLSFGIKF